METIVNTSVVPPGQSVFPPQQPGMGPFGTVESARLRRSDGTTFGSSRSEGTPPASSIMYSLAFSRFPQGTRIPGRGELALKHALEVEIEVTRDGFVVRSGALDEEAYGSTYKEACIDFLASLCDRYHSMNTRKEHLSPQDRAVRDRLRTLLGLELE